ncbi:MAG: ABC transporter permease [Gemmatimonadaceae bacterium]|nr:ABC transporter permease [Gemmatimonadaceae bacterium]
MTFALAVAALFRHRTRTLLAILGVAVSAAMLLDMVMLATGMRESFRSMLLSRGYQIRVTPRGTLPFDTEATLAGATELVMRIRANPDVAAASPVLGGQLFMPRGDTTITGTALGVDAEWQGEYELEAGTDPQRAGEVVVNRLLLRALGAGIGDTITAAAAYDAQLRSLVGERRLVITGEARFLFLAATQLAAALPIGTLQEMSDRPDQASLLVVRVGDGVDADAVAAWIEQSAPRVSSRSIEEVLKQTDERLSYFRQLAFILGATSLVVGFLLVTTLVTVSVNERIGEIAVLRAIGVSRQRVVLQIVLEGVGIMLAGTAGGLVLGLVTARFLNGILADFPGLPAAIDFFLFQPRAAWTALGLLAGAGVLAGVYPAWRAASLPIATTLREEAVG